MAVSRRAMLKLISSGTFFLQVAPTLATARGIPDDAPAVSFPQGVASADPQPTAVVLWTRAEPEQPAERVQVRLQVSLEEDFSTIVLDSLLHTGPDSDYTLRSYIDGLQPDTRYFYRFLGPASSLSRTGRTRTAPAPDQAKSVSLAFASCQSFEQGFYGSWARMLEDDKAAPEEEQIQFVLHLGDFVYERSWHQRSDGTPQSRYVPPFPDGERNEHNRYAVSLADYRHLYKTYLGDPWLQEARARWPFICVWDDHEFCDDNFQSYNTYSDQPAPQPRRKLYANRAWSEYIPAVLEELQEQPAHGFEEGHLTGEEAADNLTAIASLCIYRKLSWGRHLDLVITDNRSYRSGPCLDDKLTASLGLPMATATLVDIADGGRAYNGGNPPEFLPYGDGKTPNPALDRPPGSCLGDTQHQWFEQTLLNSQATWKLWGNSLPLLPMQLNLSAIPFAGLEDSVFHIDAWAGYPTETRQLLNFCADNRIGGVVSFSGDHHMHGVGTLYSSAPEAIPRPILVDFSCAGISSSPIFNNLVEAADKGSDAFRSLVYREADGDPRAELYFGRQLVPVWNMTLLDGVLGAMTYSATGMEQLAGWLESDRANPGLAYMDTTVNGYGLARFSEEELQVQLVSLKNLRAPFERPPQISHRAIFRLPHWHGSEPAKLEGPKFIGYTPFPFEPPTV